MKKIFVLSVVCIFAYQFSFAQPWNTGGNNIGANDFLGTINNNPIRFRTNTLTAGNNIDRMVILPGGNIGIGISTPANRLSISGATAGSSGLQFTQLNSSSTAGTGTGKYLALDASGNVILVTIPANTLTGNLPVALGGTGLTALGTASQQLRVNAAGTALEYFTPTAGGSNIYTANGTLTSNRFLDLGSSTLSFGKGANTNFHVFNSGNVWIGNAGTPVNNNMALNISGNTSVTDGILHFKTNAFTNNTRIYRERDGTYEGLVFRSAGTAGAFASKFQFLGGFNENDLGLNLLSMTRGAVPSTYSIVFGETGIAGSRIDPTARVSILAGEVSSTALSIYNPYNTTSAASYIRFSGIGWGAGSPATGTYIKSQNIANTYGGDLIFGINNASAPLNETDVMTVHRSGNVLVGTSTNNGDKLQVNGSISATGFKLPTGAGLGKVLTSDASGVASWQPAAATGVTDNIYTANGTLTSNRFVNLGTSSTLSVGKDANTNFHVFNNGRVWIGNGTPVDDASATSGTALNVRGSTLFSRNGIGSSNGGALGLPAVVEISQSSGEYGLQITRASNNSNAPHLLFFKTRGTTASSYVPTTNSTLLGEMSFVGVNSLNTPTSAGTIQVSQRGDPVTPDARYIFTTKGRSEFTFIIDGETKNIGIGNIATGVLLPSSHITFHGSDKGLAMPSGTSAQRLAIASPATGLTYYQLDNTENLYLNKSSGWKKILTEDDAVGLGNWTLNGSSIYNNNAGNVGLGVVNPDFKLQVNGTSGFGDSHDAISYGMVQITRPAVQPDNRFHISMIRSTYSVSGIGYLPNSNTLGFWHYSNDITRPPVMVFSEQQNVGIGTANPSEKLAVDGNIVARRIRVTQTGWADYVFDKEYKLPSLHELEQYIAEHHHLPEVPTEKEVKEKGADVGDTQVLLLKKVEELTLYLLQQNKELERLKKEVADLKRNKKN